ncbi:MAG: 4-hydroxy-3-methylbut-2-enyl diphosphate reductase [Muribaculaceae bacterium]|nr:4-hydroxy-3-methylbut-2-enyl diphosphate reductase [Muribaculaceae bacterium]
MIEIDEASGFCFGVVTAIKKAEEELKSSGKLYCLGDIVHNSDEVQRLRDKGLITITHEDLTNLKNVKVLLRAHGEPPSTYNIARENNIEIIDATCPVVLQLQKRIKTKASDPDGSAQIVIYGKHGHAEVNGLVGQTDGKAIVIQDVEELDKIDFNRDIEFYSQTTKSLEGFNDMISEINRRKAPNTSFHSYDTICRQVSNRVAHLREFAGRHDLVLFVSGKKSSNGKVLFHECKEVNPVTYLISNAEEIDSHWLKDVRSIGVCGATSTPRWLMEQVSNRVKELYTQNNG